MLFNRIQKKIRHTMAPHCRPHSASSQEKEGPRLHGRTPTPLGLLNRFLLRCSGLTTLGVLGSRRGCLGVHLALRIGPLLLPSGPGILLLPSGRLARLHVSWVETFSSRRCLAPNLLLLLLHADCRSRGTDVYILACWVLS